MSVNVQVTLGPNVNPELLSAFLLFLFRGPAAAVVLECFGRLPKEACTGPQLSLIARQPACFGRENLFLWESCRFQFSQLVVPLSRPLLFVAAFTVEPTNEYLNIYHLYSIFAVFWDPTTGVQFKAVLSTSPQTPSPKTSSNMSDKRAFASASSREEALRRVTKIVNSFLAKVRRPLAI